MPPQILFYENNISSGRGNTNRETMIFFRQKGHSVNIFCAPVKNPKLHQKLLSLGINVKEIKPFGILNSIRRLTQFMFRSKGRKILYTPSMSIIPLIYPFAKLTRTKIFYSGRPMLTDFTVMPEYQHFRTTKLKFKTFLFFYKIWENLNVRLSDKTIAMSQYTVSDLVKLGCPKNKMKVIYHWVDTERFQFSSTDREKIRSQWNIQENDRVLLFLAKVDRSNMKKIDVIEDIIKISRQTPNAKYLICGGGDLLETFRQRAINEKLDNVIFAGQIDYSDVHRYLSAADLLYFVLRCDMGTYGRSMIESLSNSLPILTNNSLSHQEVVQDNVNGLLVPHDLPAIAQRINQLSSQDLQKMKMRPEALEKYTAETMYQQMCQVFHHD